MVVGQAMRQRRTSYARGGQVTPRLSRHEQVPTTAGGGTGRTHSLSPSHWFLRPITAWGGTGRTHSLSPSHWFLRPITAEI